MSSAATLAIVSQSGQSLSFFDLSTGTRTAQITDLPAEPHDLAHDSEKNLLYISHTYRHGHYFAHGDICHELSVVDVKTKKVVDSIDIRPFGGPHGICIDPASHLLYATVETGFENGGGLIGVSLDSHKVVKSIPSDGRAHWLTITPNGKKAYMSNMTSPFVSVLDLENELLLTKINVTGSNQGAVSRDGQFVFIPTPSIQPASLEIQPTIEVINTATDKFVKSIKMDLGVSAVHVTSRGAVVVAKYRFEKGADPTALKAQAGQLEILDETTHERVGEVESGMLPLSLLSSPDGKIGFAANVFGGTVTVVDLVEMKVIKTLEVDTTPRDDKKFHQGAHGMVYLAGGV